MLDPPVDAVLGEQVLGRERVLRGLDRPPRAGDEGLDLAARLPDRLAHLHGHAPCGFLAPVREALHAGGHPLDALGERNATPALERGLGPADLPVDRALVVAVERADQLLVEGIDGFEPRGRWHRVTPGSRRRR